MAIMATGLDHADNLTTNVIKLTPFEIIESMVPLHALVKVQRYLRHECRKPADMRVRNYYQHLVFINTQELTLLPPFGVTQSFNNHDLMDILLFATPKKWQHKMDQMGFNPLASSPDALLAFMENCEVIEDYDTANMTMARKPNNSKNGNNKGAKPSDPKKQKWCDNHGWTNHTTAKCKKNKPGFNSFKKGNNKPKGKAFGNRMNAKSWQRKSNEPNKEVQKKEMNAIMKSKSANISKRKSLLSPRRMATATSTCWMLSSRTSTTWTWIT